jgi:hypothetical protein
MEPQQQGVRTTSDSQKEGRLMVDANISKKKRKILKNTLKNYY